MSKKPVIKAKRSPATRRFEREKLEKELTVRFLVMKILQIRGRLSHIVELKGPSQRLNEVHALLADVNHLSAELQSIEPYHRNMTFYLRRHLFDKKL